MKEEEQKLKEWYEKEIGQKIKDYVFEEFLKEVGSVNDNNRSKFVPRMKAKNIVAQYETVKYYRFLLMQNYMRLIADIDKHVIYNLLPQFTKVHPFMSLFNIELNANFINYLESLHGIRECILALKNRFSDDTFIKQYDTLLSGLSQSTSVLIKIRNVYHHAKAFRLAGLTITQLGESEERRYAIKYEELLEKCDLNKEEKEYLASIVENDYIDVKKIVMESYNNYMNFLNKYESSLTDLIKRLTGHQITIFI